MYFASLKELSAQATAITQQGPLALVIAEDDVELEETIHHHVKLGFSTIIVFLPEGIDLPEADRQGLHVVRHDTRSRASVTDAVNTVIGLAAGQWIFYCFNSEFLIYPFCESRNIRELLAFHTEERRDAMVCFVLDLYAGDLAQAPNAVARNNALFDSSGYYSLARNDPENPGETLDRQIDFFGGLRWRFEEELPELSRRMDRVALFRAAKGLQLRPDHTFNQPEYNTISCPWHNNVSAAIASFRVAKALRSNTGSSERIDTFRCAQSIPFEWSSQQLMDLGFIEPGQWF